MQYGWQGSYGWKEDSGSLPKVDNSEVARTVARIRQLRQNIAQNPGDMDVYNYCTEEIRQLSATLPPGTQC